MKSEQYWSDRANERMANYHKNSDETINKITAAYDKAMKDINEDINKIFWKYTLDSGLTPGETIELLNSKIPTKEIEHIRARIVNIQDVDLKRYMMAQLNSNAYKARITRLEALKESINVNTKVLADKELQYSTQGYIGNINEAYYRSIFDIEKGIGLGISFAEMPTEVIQEILKNPWSGKNYSERIWKNSEVLAEELEKVITSGLMSGKGSKKMAKELSHLTDVGKFAAERLVRTETTYITNQAELEGYKEMDIEQYVFVSTLDKRTSKQCRDMDGVKVKISEAEAGKNLPPLHPYCRSTTIAYFGEETLNSMQRRARDTGTGKNEVIKNMSYEEWYKKYDNGDIIEVNNRKEDIPDWKGINYSSNYKKKEAVKQLKDTHGIEFKDSKKYPIEESILSDCVGWLDSFSEEYKSFTENNPCKIPGIICNPPSKMKAMGYYSYYKNSNKVVELALNAKYHSDINLFEGYVKKCVESKWSPANATTRKTFVHEMGHHISNSLRVITNNQSFECNFINECIQEFKKIEPNYTYNTYVGMTDYVSKYGSTSEGELFAETFAEYFGGDKPREFAKIFGGKLDKILKEVK